MMHDHEDGEMVPCKKSSCPSKFRYDHDEQEELPPNARGLCIQHRRREL